ncbi:dirigent protein 23-like [Aristolochia californica]|uniref:dirigent protein 23-like n=1 Tax=Aristolochia californica TaxID=171875 RepID=UPI0035E2FF04
MGKVAQGLLLVLALLALSSAGSQGFGEELTHMGNWRHRLGLGKEKITQLHFFFHDTLSGRSPSAVPIAEAEMTDKSPTVFGKVMMADDPLTEGPELKSKEVGRAQGIYGSAGQEGLSLIMAMSFSFTEEKYNGSSFSLMSRNPAMNPVRELAIVGGTGLFRLAKGYVVAKTYWVNVTSGDAIVEYNATLVHY